MELIIKDLDKNYGKKQVLKHVSYSFQSGMIYSILGRNGAGKTTLFNCLSNQTTYENGSVLLSDGTSTRLLTYEDIGLVSASPQLPDFLTGYEFVHFFAELNSKKTEDKGIDDFFDIVQINTEDRHKLIKDYSYGMKNKLQLLCCLIRNPLIILLDEPLSSFDIIVSHEIKELLLKMKKDHIILMCTHIMQLAQDISDTVLLLLNGRIEIPEFTDIHSADFEQSVIAALERQIDE